MHSLFTSSRPRNWRSDTANRLLANPALVTTTPLVQVSVAIWINPKAVHATVASATEPARDEIQAAPNTMSADDAEVTRHLAKVPLIEYDRCRENEAERAGGRVSTLFDNIKKLRRK